jgi:single-strand DNA-binding protein
MHAAYRGTDLRKDDEKMNETYVTVMGKVITEINQRTIPSGDKVCSFRLVAGERRFNREQQEWVDGDKLFIQVTCWRKLAENVGVSLFKGDNVIVHGRLYLNEYEVNGEPKKMLQLDARAVGPNLLMCAAMVQRPKWGGDLNDEAVAATPATPVAA